MENMAVEVICADVLEWAAEYDGLPFHAILCDPPYHLTQSRCQELEHPSWNQSTRQRRANKIGFMGQEWDGGDIAFRPETWAALAEHLLPGAFVMAFGGCRTYHRLACALENAGLRLHNAIGWVFGTGFPKATRIKTKQWQSTNEAEKSPSTTWRNHRYGIQALKPALELITVAQKPYEGRPVNNIVATGAGALNIEAGRVGIESIKTNGGGGKCGTVYSWANFEQKGRQWESHSGRWPPNFALVHSPGCVRTGTRQIKGHTGYPHGQGGYLGGVAMNKGNEENDIQVRTSPHPGYADANGLETVDDWLCEESCAVRMLKEQSEKNKTGDGNTCARFYPNCDWSYEVTEQLAESMSIQYCAKASRKERDAGLMTWKNGPRHTLSGEQCGNANGRNSHPTVKPISLCLWLAKLLLPPPKYAPRHILVPFSGSGSEMIACALAGWEDIVGIDNEASYCEIAKARLRFWHGWQKRGYDDPAMVLKQAAQVKRVNDRQIEMEL